MPWCLAQISAPIPRPGTSSCGVFHTHQDPDQLIGQTSPVRGLFWDPIYVGEKHACRGAKAEDPLRYRAPGARDSGEEAGGDGARVTCKL